jgi:hypothetical protein
MRTTKGRLGCALVILASVCGGGILAPLGAVAAPAAWQEDFRRCLIRKPFDGGTLTISASDGALEIDVLWADDTGLDAFKATGFRAQIDQKSIDIQTLKNDAGEVYAYALGPSATIGPLLSGGRSLALAFTDHPERDLRLEIGNGRKAVAFLEKCRNYWEKWRKQHP